MSNQFHFGIVEDRKDPLGMGRVRVRVFGLHNILKEILPTEDLPWATILLPSTNAGTSGIGESPNGIVEGSHVIVMFLDKFKQHPIVFGVIPGISGYEDYKTVSENNQNPIGDGSVYDAMLKYGITEDSLKIPETKKDIADSISSNIKNFGIFDEVQEKIITASICAIGYINNGLDISKSIEKFNFSSVDSLKKSFAFFKNKTDDFVKSYIKSTDPKQFFEVVYGHETPEGKLLGNKQEGDGFKYCGRGLIQIKGRTEYENITKILKSKNYDIDLVKEPLKVLDPLYYGIISLAICEERGVINTNININNPIAYFQDVLNKIDDNKNKEEKINKFKEFLNIKEIPNSLPANTRYKVGSEDAISENLKEEIKATQELQSTNIILGNTKPIKSLDEINQQSIEYNNKKFAYEEQATKEKIEFNNHVNDLRNKIAETSKEQKQAIKNSLDLIANICDPANTQYKEYREWIEKSNEVYHNSTDGIFDFIGSFTNELNNLKDIFDNQMTEFDSMIRDLTGMVDENIVDSNNIITESIESILNDVGLGELYIGANDILPESVIEAKNRMDSIIRQKQSDLYNKTLGTLNNNVFQNINKTVENLNSFTYGLPRNFINLLNKFGLGVINSVGANNDYMQNIVNKLSYGIQNKIGFSVFQMNEMTNKRLQNKIYGFCDPNGKYPLRDHVGEPATNKIARGKLDNTIFDWLKENQKTNIPVAGSNNNINELNNINVPVIMPKGEYPYTKVIQSESGHITVKDDTPGNEILAEYHRTGTGQTIGSDGSVVKKIVGDDYTVIDKNGVISISGKAIVSINDGANVTVIGNAVFDVKGTTVLNSDSIILDSKKATSIISENDINIESTKGSVNIKSGRDVNIDTQNKINVQSTKDININTSNNLNINVAENINKKVLGNNNEYVKNNKNTIVDNLIYEYSNGDKTSITKNNLIYKSKNGQYQFEKLLYDVQGNYHINTKGNYSIKSNANIAIKSDGDFMINGSGSMNIKSSGIVGIDGSFTYIQSGRSKDVDLNSIDMINYEIVQSADKILSVMVKPFELSYYIKNNFITNPKIPFSGGSFSIQQAKINYNITEKDLLDV